MASFLAYFVGELGNSTILALPKYKMQGRLLFVRTIGSRVVQHGLDSFIFMFLAFVLFGDLPATALFDAELAQWKDKMLNESVATPLTYLVVGFIKKKEEMDVTEVPHSLNPQGIFR